VRTLTVAAKQSIFAQNTDIVWLLLLTIDHAELADPIRVVNNIENVFSRGNTYTAFPFEITLPGDDEDRPPGVNLSIGNVDRSVIIALRGLSSSPTVVLELVTTNDVNAVEIGPLEFTFDTITYDAITVSGDLTYEPILTQNYPAHSFVPNLFPGLF